MRRLVLFVAALMLPATLHAAEIPPLEAEILDANEQRTGTALVYPNYVEVLDGVRRERGRVGVVVVEGRSLLFTVRKDEKRSLVGWARNHRLHNAQDEVVGYYKWTPVWSYVYDEEMNKVGQAQCLAYQGVCAAAVAGYLLGLY